MDEKDVFSTALVTHHRLFKYLQMPFDLKNAPETFWRPLNVILASFKWQQAILFIDDIIIFLMTPKQHLHDIKG